MPVTIKQKWVHLLRPSPPYSGKCPVPLKKADSLVRMGRARLLSLEEAGAACLRLEPDRDRDELLEYLVENFVWGDELGVPNVENVELEPEEDEDDDEDKGSDEPETDASEPESDEDEDDDEEGGEEDDGADYKEILKGIAKENGIERYWVKSVSTLEKELTEKGVDY